jgi:hypothetical protein
MPVERVQGLALPEALEQAGEVAWHGRLELHAAVVDRMTKGETGGVQGLPRERDGARVLWPVHVSLLAHERVPPQRGLKTNLVAPARHKSDLDQRCVAEGFDHSIVASGLLSSRVARGCFLLDQSVPIPREMIAPDSRPGRRMAVHHREIDALRLVAPKLCSQTGLRIGASREHHESRCVAVDPVYDERPVPAP